MSMAQKLELNWIGKHDPKYKISPEPRILVENPEYSYSNSEAIVNEQLSFEEKNKIYFDNMLIHGDNLLALKSLELEYAGKIKCIYIDPPYNTGSAFEHYDYNLEHSAWLNLMKPRIELLKCLLSKNGIICIQIDDSPNSATGQSHEKAYLQILMDEVFGRKNYITNLVWKKKGNSSNTVGTLGTITESIFVYAKDKKYCKVNRQHFEKTYKFKDDMGAYNLETFLKTDEGAYKRDTMKFEITDYKSGKTYLPPEGKRWTYGKNTIDELNKNGLLVFKNNRVYVKKYEEENSTKLYNNLLLEHGSLKSAKEELSSLGFSRESFETPKPEILLESILNMFSNPGDIVLDSFLGSGTTVAVAHKMGRRWIGIELGNHAYTHCYKRLKSVVDGEQGGISKDVNWKGGGGFKFYELAPSLIEKDKFGNPVISDKYTGEMLAEAIAKHKGYYYQPNAEFFWKQSKNGDKNFLYVTENHITPQDLNYIHTLMKQDEHLLVCAPSYESECSNQFPNITIQQIPKVLFGKCDFMKEGYSLNVNQNENSEEDN